MLYILYYLLEEIKVEIKMELDRAEIKVRPCYKACEEGLG